MDSPKHCRMGNRAGSLFDSGHNYPGGIKNLYYYNERAGHIFVFCLYRAGAEGSMLLLRPAAQTFGPSAKRYCRENLLTPES